MRAAGRHAGRCWNTAVLAVLICLPALSAGADGFGLLLAPAALQMNEAEATYAEAVLVALVASDQRAVVLHEDSPLVRVSPSALPKVSSDDDWVALESVLSRLAVQLRLDYVLILALDAEAGTGNAMLVVRGGGSKQLQAPADDPPAMAAQAVAATTQLPPPHDPVDESIAIGPVDEPAVATSAPTEEPVVALPPEEERPPVIEPGAPVAVADEPTDIVEPAVPDGTQAVESGSGELAPVLEALASGELERARALIAQHVAAHGSSAETHYLTGRVAVGELRRDDAVEDFRRAVALDPTLAEAQVWLARLLDERGMWQTAAGHYEQALETDPTHQAGLIGLARLYRDHGHRRKAITLLTEAADRGQNDPAVLALLAELHGHEGNVQLAERFFLRAAGATTGEERASAFERLGDLYVGQQRHREALGYYLRAAELNPSRVSMVQRRYREVMAAADGSVREAVTLGWGIFDDYAESGTGEREMVYRRFSEMHGQLQEAMRFVDGVQPPAELRAEHVQRQFAYSLALEATVAAITWLDLGDEQMRERAQQVHAEALAEFKRLGDGSCG
ncbi:MAG: tetratricopeptide repeat protein [candidate division WS1 bacterium]|nr:tetratricopeptide repeat protein [candidate division WS1 bacterium]